MRRIVLAITAGILSGAAAAPTLAQLGEGGRAAALLTRYRVIPNVTYTTQSNTDLKLDLYLPPPEQGAPPVPVLIAIHGGGWIAGTKEDSQLEVLPYLEMGYAAVNVEYRLARSALAPAAVEDCRCALRWVLRNAKRYNLDTGRIVLTGGSAGGHLALITGMLPAEVATDPDRLRRFEREAHAIAARNHPNIVAIHDIGVHEGSPYLVSELLEGESLRQRLAGAPLAPPKAMDLAVQIAVGLAAVHGRPTVDRDLKPANTPVTKDSHVKIRF